MNSFRFQQITVCIVVFAITFSLFTFGNQFHTSAQQSVKITEDTASQGRKITPAGNLLIDATTNKIAIGSLPVDFVRSPDTAGKDGKGRYLLAINSGFGIQFSAETNRGQQSIAVIDLNIEPDPKVIQNVYFPSPQSVNIGVRFVEKADSDGNFRLFVSGGYENKVWLFKFSPNAATPVTPLPKKDTTTVIAPSINVAGLATNAPSPNYNDNVAAVYPTGIAISPDAETLLTANNLGDTLGIISDLRDTRKITRIPLQRPNSTQFVYPYDVEIIPANDGKNIAKAYISLWGDGTIAVVDLKNNNKLSHITVERHPTAMILNKDKSRLYVVNSNADSVSVIDTATDRVVERINLKLAESEPIGSSPEGLALSDDEKMLFVANAHANAVAVIALAENLKAESKTQNPKSKILGFIPTGQYASAVAVVGNKLFIGNGKGTGVENSSLIVNNSGRVPNAPNELFPPTETRLGGQYSGSIVVGNISTLTVPDERQLFTFTQQVMQNNQLLGVKKGKLFKGANPFKHVIYIIRENRTYDQVFGDLEKSGDGTKADGNPRLAIFGAGETAKSPNGQPQNITPNARALVTRFGLLDRFFVNAEASPDGHNWSTAAFSNDYVDKAFRWDYSGRGRTYDYEGFNRLPSFNPPSNQPPVALPPVFDLPATENDIANYLKRYVPYLNGARDIGEPETLYLWDAAGRAGLTYRNYGEFIATVSADDLKEVNTQKAKKYPDISPTVTAFAAKKSLENHFSPSLRNFDQNTPDSMTTDSYRAFKESNGKTNALITEDNPDARFRGHSRLNDWLKDFNSYNEDMKNGKGDKMPNLSIVRFSNDHTAGLHKGTPTPQFFVAENDYAIGKVIEAVSSSPFWKNTAIFIVEDDAQDGPDHVDAHRSPGFVISAYNRKGALIHDFHNTVSLIRTIEILLGIAPMNLLDSTATPIDIFQDTPDLTPYQAIMPDVALDNLMPPDKPTAEMRKYMNLTAKQDLKHQDMADPKELNEIIWFSVRGNLSEMPEIARLPAFDLMTTGLVNEELEDERAEKNEAQNNRESNRIGRKKRQPADADD
jgi:YVTN family beta-propeller protein